MTAPDSPDAVPPPESSNEPSAERGVEPSEQLELKLPGEASSWRDLALWAGVLVLLSLIAFWPAVGGRFQWLDERAVANNRLLAVPGGLSFVWSGRWERPAMYPLASYQPVAFTVRWLAYRLGGHDALGLPTPTAYHVASVVAHGLAAVLAWLAMRELAVPAAWLAAAVFALHPGNAEAVSWISDGGVPVAGALAWGSAYAYLMYQTFRARDAADKAAGGPGGDPAQTWGLYATSAVCAILAALAWPAAGGAAGVILLALWWRNRATKLDVALLAPVLVVGVFLWLADLALARPAGATGVDPVAETGVLHIVRLTVESLGFAALKLVLPIRLSLIYPSNLLGRSMAVVGVALVAFAYRRRHRGPAAGLAAFALCAVPAMNWVDPARHGQVIDPVMYLATVPMVALALAFVVDNVRQYRPAVLAQVQTVVIAAAVLLLLLGIGSWRRAYAFDTPVSLWQDTADKQPRSPFARSQLAEQLRLRAADDAANDELDKTKADLTDAIGQAKVAVDLADGNRAVAAQAQRTWAAALVAQGDPNAALPHYAAATAPDAGPADAATLVDYGQALYTLGHVPEAERQLNAALEADYTYGPAHRVLGQTFAKVKNPTRELSEYRLAVLADPSDLAAQQLLAEALASRGQLDEAMQRYVLVLSDQANRNKPDLLAAVARVLARQDKMVEAVAAFHAAKKLDPKIDVDKEMVAAEDKLKREAATRPPMTHPTTGPTTAPADLGSPAS